MNKAAIIHVFCVLFFLSGTGCDKSGQEHVQDEKAPAAKPSKQVKKIPEDTEPVIDKETRALIEKYEPECRGGDPDACVQLGHVWNNRVEGKGSRKKAREYYRTACNMNTGGEFWHDEGCFHNAIMMWAGRGGKALWPTARDIFREGCMKRTGGGYGPSCFEYAMMNFPEDGVDVYDQIKRACELGFDAACTMDEKKLAEGRKVGRKILMVFIMQHRFIEGIVKSMCPFRIIPGKSIGPLKVGMKKQEVEKLMKEKGLDARGPKSIYSAVKVKYSPEDTVDWMEAYHPVILDQCISIKGKSFSDRPALGDIRSLFNDCMIPEEAFGIGPVLCAEGGISIMHKPDEGDITSIKVTAVSSRIPRAEKPSDRM